VSQATPLSILPGALSLIGRTTACFARIAGFSRGSCRIGERTTGCHGAAASVGRHVIAGAFGVQLAPEVGERDVLGRGRERAGANVRLERPRPEHACAMATMRREEVRP
jgi:hypothetical protein